MALSSDLIEKNYIDSQLRSRIAQGEEESFSIFFKHYQHRVMQIAFFFTRSETYSKDIVQDVFLKIWNARARLADIDYPDAWVATITRNLTFSALKKMAREELADGHYIDYIPNTEFNKAHSKVDYSEVTQYVQEALLQLPEQQRQVFKMAKLDGLSREAIADQLKISPNTVKVHLLRSTHFVRGYLQQKLDYLTFFILAVYFL